MLKQKQWACLLTAAALFAGTASFPELASDAAETILHTADFESGSSGWTSFGSQSVSTTNNASHSGSYSLYVDGRTDTWHGTSCSMESILVGGKTYGFSAWVMQSAASTDTIQLQLKYTDGSGNAQYKTIGSADASQGNWYEISADYDIPSDATDILIYFQTNGTTNSFYVDDISITGEATWSTEALDETPLKDIYANYFRIGCAVTPSELNTEISKEIVKHHFNSVTIGNELKPDYVMDQAATQAIGDNVTVAVSLDEARSVLTFCEENNIPVRGHVLLWHSQTPDWFFKEGFSSSGAYVSKEIMNQRIDNYIKAVFEAFENEFPDLNVYCWDVVNECYMEDGSLRAAGTNPDNGDSEWTMIYGDNSYIEQAFVSARKYAPADCKLFYNDYNEYIQGKRDAIYNMAADLAAKGLIDGIGMQSHLDVGYPDANLYRQAIEKYAQLGLEIQVTELDITQYDNTSDLSAQTQAYEDIMKVIVEEKQQGANITAVVFWGITDGTSWRKTGYPLLFSADYSVKDSFYAVAGIIDESEWGEATEPEATEPTTEEPTTEPTTEFIDDTIVEETTEDWTEPGMDYAILGDVDQNGTVNTLDVILLQKYLIQQEDLPLAAQRVSANVIADDRLDVFDLGALKKLVIEGQN